MEIDEVKSINDCIEAATVDANGDEEAAEGWLTCIQEVFNEVSHVKILGGDVTLKEFDLVGNSVVAVCEKGGKKVKVALDSIELIKPTTAQKLWVKAWKNWATI